MSLGKMTNPAASHSFSIKFFDNLSNWLNSVKSKHDFNLLIRTIILSIACEMQHDLLVLWYLSSVPFAAFCHSAMFHVLSPKEGA
jgi:translation initiation factor RLI1